MRARRNTFNITDTAIAVRGNIPCARGRRFDTYRRPVSRPSLHWQSL